MSSGDVKKVPVHQGKVFYIGGKYHQWQFPFVIGGGPYLEAKSRFSDLFYDDMDIWSEIWKIGFF